MSGIEVSLRRMSRILSRTSRAAGRNIGARLSMLRMMFKIGGIARKASSSCSNEAFSIRPIQVSILSRFAWKDESVREIFPPMVTFCLDVRYFTKSVGFFLSMNVMISKNTQPREKTSAFSVSWTLDRGLGTGFIFLKPKLKPEKSVVGTLVSFCLCELLLFEEPDELLLMIEACLVLGTMGAGAAPVSAGAATA